EPHWIEVVRRDLPITRLPSALVGKRLVQLSDIHIGKAVSDDFLLDAFEITESLRPDLLALTGDFMTCTAGEELDHALRILEHLPAGRLGTVGILGNHDYGNSARETRVADRLTKGLTELGVTML